MSCDNASSFGALGMVLVKGTLGYILLRLGRSQEGLEVGQTEQRQVPLNILGNLGASVPLRTQCDASRAFSVDLIICECLDWRH